MDKTAVAHWAPEIGGQFWWNGVFFVLIFVPFMLFIGKKLSSKQRDYMLYGMGAYQLVKVFAVQMSHICLLYTSPSPRDRQKSRMPSSA